jgi:hypothetical protein
MTGQFVDLPFSLETTLPTLIRSSKCRRCLLRQMETTRPGYDLFIKFVFIKEEKFRKISKVLMLIEYVISSIRQRQQQTQSQRGRPTWNWVGFFIPNFYMARMRSEQPPESVVFDIDNSG